MTAQKTAPRHHTAPKAATPAPRCFVLSNKHTVTVTAKSFFLTTVTGTKADGQPWPTSYTYNLTQKTTVAMLVLQWTHCNPKLGYREL